MRYLLLCCLAGLLACDRSPVQQDTDITNDAGEPVDARPADQGEGSLDMGPQDQGLDARLTDAEIDATRPGDGSPDASDQDLLPDGMPDVMQFPPPVEPSPEVECNALDDDDDGLVDEGVANLCGGCGPIPETGCQFWRVNLIQDAQIRLNPNRVVGLSGTILGTEVAEIDNGVCEIVRLVSRPRKVIHWRRRDSGSACSLDIDAHT